MTMLRDSSYLISLRGVKVSAALRFPDPLLIAEAELATVFANALESAIHACERIEMDER